MDTWKNERDLRIKYEKRDSIEAFNLDIKEINDDNDFMINDIKIEHFKVDHKPVVNAYGYNFINQEYKITISGDTRPCENLNKYAINSNIELRWQRRSYDVGVYIKPKEGIGGVRFRFNDFDFKGKGVPFAKYEPKPLQK